MPANNVQFYSTDPNEQASFAQQQALLNQRQAMAQALLQQGMSPLETQGRQVGNIGYRISPFEGLAKILQSAVGRQEMQQTAKDQANLQAQSYANLLRQFGGDQPNPINPNGLPAAAAVGWLQSDPKSYWETAGKRWTPTDTTTQATQAGVDPTQANRQALSKTLSDPKVYGMLTAGLSPEQIKQAFYGEAAKAAEIDRKAGNQFSNPVTGESGFVPKIPDYANPVGKPAPNGALPGGVAPMPGAVPIAANTAGAVKGAQEANSIGTVTGPDGSQVPAWMGPAARVGGAQLGLSGGGAPGARPPAMPAPGGQVPQAPQQPQQAQQPRLGVPTGVPQQIEATQKRWSDLQAANSEAGNTKAYLSSIKQYADKAATGQFTDKLQFTNSILGLIGNEKATDATTANNLLDKYSNQIVARLGQNGLGTDAARSILQSAYPNAKMTPQAIKEAADNLIGAQDMVQAKTRFLEKHGNARDAVNYQQAERAFDQAADPRLFQLKNMDAQAAQRFLQSLPPQAQAELRQKAATLKQLGVF